MNVKELQKKFKGLTLANGIPELKRISSGNVGLDFLMGGGLPVGRVVQLYGAGSVGKSSTACSILREVIKLDNWYACYLDYEKTISKEDLDRLGIPSSSDKFLYKRCYTAEEGVDIIKDLSELEDDVHFLYIVDTVASMIPQRTLDAREEDSGKLDFGNLAKFISINKPVIEQSLEQSQSIMIALNQVRIDQKVTMGALHNVEYYPGGKALEHLASIVFHLSSTGKVVDAETNAIKTKFYVKKNKCGRRGGSLEMYITANGLDRTLPLLTLGLETGLISRKGSFYHLDEELFPTLQDLKLHGETNTLKVLNEQEIYDKLSKEILKHCVREVQSPKEETDDE